MNPNKRPLSILILACVYIGIGTLGFVYHFNELLARHADAIGIELTEFVAIICGIFLLRGNNWARWLALAWIAFHVAISMLHNLGEVAVHGLACVVIAYILLRPAANRYFRGIQVNS